MRRFRFCDRCGVPWGSHVRRCPGCGRPRVAMSASPALLLLALAVATLLQAKCEGDPTRDTVETLAAR